MIWNLVLWQTWAQTHPHVVCRTVAGYRVLSCKIDSMISSQESTCTNKFRCRQDSLHPAAKHGAPSSELYVFLAFLCSISFVTVCAVHVPKSKPDSSSYREMSVLLLFYLSSETVIYKKKLKKKSNWKLKTLETQATTSALAVMNTNWGLQRSKIVGEFHFCASGEDR